VNPAFISLQDAIKRRVDASKGIPVLLISFLRVLTLAVKVSAVSWVTKFFKIAFSALGS
jgi:hypothetical protein